MSGFEAALDFVLAREGGYVNHPKDPGGETNMGITRRSYPEEDIKGMTRGRAAFLYRRDYWQPAHCEGLPPALGLAVFDCAVNQGVGAAGKFLQRAVGTTPDGRIGPHTLALVKMSQTERVLDDFLALREAHYRSLPTFVTFGDGWLNRLAEVERAATQLLEKTS